MDHCCCVPSREYIYQDFVLLALLDSITHQWLVCYLKIILAAKFIVEMEVEERWYFFKGSMTCRIGDSPFLLTQRTHFGRGLLVIIQTLMLQTPCLKSENLSTMGNMQTPPQPQSIYQEIHLMYAASLLPIFTPSFLVFRICAICFLYLI